MIDPITCSVDEKGIGWITFDDPASKVNMFTPETLACFKKTFKSLAGERGIRAVIVQSAKKNIFIAGADLRWVERFVSAREAYEFARDGQRFLNSISNFKVPVIAAIHGACAGGGYELALACHYRLASDDPKTQIGLPEVAVGTMPAWGSCMRLPRLIGIRGALDHILGAQLLPAMVAKEKGLVDEVAPVAELKDHAARACENISQFVGKGRPRQSAAFENERSKCAAVCSEARRLFQDETRKNTAAALKVIEVIEKGGELSIEEALELEARGFSEVTFTSECKNLIRAFFSARQPKN